MYSALVPLSLGVQSASPVHLHPDPTSLRTPPYRTGGELCPPGTQSKSCGGGGGILGSPIPSFPVPTATSHSGPTSHLYPHRPPSQRPVASSRLTRTSDR